MSKILVVEPHKILQQAITLSLFLDHDVQVQESVPDLDQAGLKNFELLIIDAAALRELGKLTPGIAQALQNWKIPTLWIEDGNSPEVPKGEKFEMITKPIEKEAFRAAIARRLGSPGGSQLQQDSAPSRGEKPASKGTSGRENTSAEELEKEPMLFIDLVDVVEEGKEPRKTRGQARKPQ